MAINVPEIIASSRNELVNIFKDIHTNPETGFEEVKTSRIVKDKLSEFGVDEIHSKIGKTGVVGIIRGKGSGNRSVGIRADMDALPIQEKVDLDYASKIPGCFNFFKPCLRISVNILKYVY